VALTTGCQNFSRGHPAPLECSNSCMQSYAVDIRKEDIATFHNGKQALYISKLMLVKMAHKDWTPIDRQWVSGQAKRLRAMIPVAVHFGCEGSLANNNVDAPFPLTVGSTEVPSGPGIGVAETQAQVELVVELPSELADFVADILASPSSNSEAGLLKIEVTGGGGSSELEDGSANSRKMDEEVDLKGVQVKLLLSMDDHELRLGLLQTAETLPAAAGAAPGLGAAATAVPDVDSSEVEADIKKLEAKIVCMLGFQRHVQDSRQFRFCFCPAFCLGNICCLDLRPVV
jgi:hypothetical protein